uniref:peptide-methionine (S)-S-oxide reductase n=1 Tax=Calidris pygmaea TaxID=425635 RepID=A0A8C3JY24_9CHAR
MAIFGMGCFWGAEQLFWRTPGVFSTQVGFSGGFTPNPTYEEVDSANGQSPVTARAPRVLPWLPTG